MENAQTDRTTWNLLVEEYERMNEAGGGFGVGEEHWGIAKSADAHDYQVVSKMSDNVWLILMTSEDETEWAFLTDDYGPWVYPLADTVSERLFAMMAH